MDKTKFNESIIEKDDDGRQFWIFVNPANIPDVMLETEISEDELLSLSPEMCYFDDVESWSDAAVDTVNTKLIPVETSLMEPADRAVFVEAMASKKRAV